MNQYESVYKRFAIARVILERPYILLIIWYGKQCYFVFDFFKNIYAIRPNYLKIEKELNLQLFILF